MREQSGLRILGMVVALAVLSVGPADAQGQQFSGKVAMLEAWRQGNVAFTLATTGVPCNGQFILNKSDLGTKNMYAMLVAAKTTGATVRVYFEGCGSAEGTSTSYAQVAYLYLEAFNYPQLGSRVDSLFRYR